MGYDGHLFFAANKGVIIIGSRTCDVSEAERPGICEVSFPVCVDVSTGFNCDFKMIKPAVRKKQKKARISKGKRNQSIHEPHKRTSNKLFHI